ncbi:MAG: PD-(D/E)XK nuclease family protein [Phycisphaeraceae bacterium]|nr:PD-(D/E)XK nuclease family protein [Phycisphaeraceae bacterium]
MASLDHVERVFLGSDSPALHAAVDWLIREFGGADLDLGEVLIAVPGGRAKRRLEELLAQEAAGLLLVPPTVVTLGGLADRLLPEAGEPVAGRLASVLVWASVLREAEEALIRDVVPQSPVRDDWPGWWALAEQVVMAADELGANRLLLSDVPERSNHPGDLARWEALSTLCSRYETRLAEQGRIDRHRARLDAIDAGACRCASKAVLLGLADLQPIHSAMLACLESPVVALIAADESDAAGFDGFGGLIAAYWAERDIPIEDEAIILSDQPSDQAASVLDAIRGWAEQGPISADQITVGMGDARLAGPLERTFLLAGLPVRSAAGHPMGGARPVQLLKAIAAFANGQRFDTLATLLRHPDAEASIASSTGEPARAWLTLLDRYATDHLAARPTGGWLGDEAQAMQAVYQAACALIPDEAGALRPLHEWAEPIAQVLRGVYGQQVLQRYAEHDRVLVVALEQVADALQDVVSIDPAIAPYCTFTHALTLVVNEVSSKAIPDPGGSAAIELVGYLELLLDDAPRMVIAGMNEQHVPEPPRTSPLLSEGIRRGLGLTDDAHRLARDGYALTTMLAWRKGMRLVVGKRSVGGDPLLPSRLLLKTDDETLVKRIHAFADEQDLAAAPMLLTPGKHDRFLLPMPVLPPEPITSMRVTAFKDYLACPYRFYLKHVLKLEPLNDDSVELSARWFGTLAHESLRILANDELRGVTNRDTIAQRLGSALDAAFARRFGSDPPVAARVQVEQIRYRLRAFAVTHAQMIGQGWRIEHEEKTRRAEVLVDGEPFMIRGQIDRIDAHPEHGHRIIDYKTSDTAKRPDQTHLKTADGQRQWVDLQLPLYLDLAAELGVDASAQLGYINLPKKTADTAFAEAGWGADLLQAARGQRDFVIRQVRAGMFWPPKQPPVYDDGLGGVCGDEVADRAALIAASAGGGA